MCACPDDFTGQFCETATDGEKSSAKTDGTETGQAEADGESPTSTGNWKKYTVSGPSQQVSCPDARVRLNSFYGQFYELPTSFMKL